MLCRQARPLRDGFRPGPRLGDLGLVRVVDSQPIRSERERRAPTAMVLTPRLVIAHGDSSTRTDNISASRVHLKANRQGSTLHPTSRLSLFPLANNRSSSTATPLTARLGLVTTGNWEMV